MATSAVPTSSIETREASRLALGMSLEAAALACVPTGMFQKRADLMLEFAARHAEATGRPYERALLHAGDEPLQMEVEARVRGRRYVEDRDTVALLSGSKDREIEFTERWTFALDGREALPWRLVGGAAPRAAD